MQGMPGEGGVKKDGGMKPLRLLLVAVSVLILDQLTKLFILKGLSLGTSIPVLKDIFHITLVYNKGAAFGLFKGQNTFFILLGIVALLFIFYYLPRLKGRKVAAFACALLLGGISGNLIDRLRFGSVVDFFDFRIWPVFNVADSAITIGAILIIAQLVRSKFKF